VQKKLNQMLPDNNNVALCEVSHTSTGVGMTVSNFNKIVTTLPSDGECQKKTSKRDTFKVEHRSQDGIQQHIVMAIKYKRKAKN